MLLTCSLLVFVDHTEWAVTELGTGIRLGMDQCNLIELLCNEIGNVNAGAF